MSCGHSFETFVLAHRKLKYLTHPPPDDKSDAYEEWLSDDAAIITWLGNSMESAVVEELCYYGLQRRYGTLSV